MTETTGALLKSPWTVEHERFMHNHTLRQISFLISSLASLSVHLTLNEKDTRLGIEALDRVMKNWETFKTSMPLVPRE